MPRNTGSLIVVEGPDGVGKSTLSKAICKYFKGSLDEFLLLSFPGRENGTLGNLVYELHHQPGKLNVKNLTNSSNQLLHIAAHIDTIERVILPTLNSGKNVLLDRFWWSTWVYGIADGVKRSSLKKMVGLEESFWKNLKPSAAFLLYRDNPIDRKVNLDHWNTLSHEYSVLAEKEKENTRSLNYLTTAQFLI